MDDRFSPHFRRNGFPAVLASIMILILFFIISANASGRDGPAITGQPSNANVSEGESASFSVTAAGTGTLSYQWYLVGGDGRGIPVGGNSSAYETGAVTTENSGQQYYVIVTDDTGSSTSNTVTLTVTLGLSIQRQPVDATVMTGNSATFTVEAAGDQPYTYQWYVDMNTGSWVARGSSESSFSTHSVTAEQDGWRFYVHVIGASGANIDSSIATLHVIQGLAFIRQPEDARIVSGGTATFTADAAGQGELTYQWYVDRGDGRWSAVGSGGRSYTTPAVTMDYNGYTYMCRAFGDEGRSLDSNPASLTVFLPSPSITRHPDNVYAHAGIIGTFTVQAQGDEPLSYLWSVDQGDGRWHELSATGSTYTTEPLTQAYSGWQYRCTVTDANGRSRTSEPGIVYISPIITPASLPDGTAGIPYSQTLTASGTPPFTWTIDGGALPPGLILTSSGILSGTPTAPGTYIFSVKADNAAGSDTQSFGIVIEPAPVYSAGLTPGGVALPDATEGYGGQAAQEFTIMNTGTGQLTGLSARLEDAAAFEISTPLSGTSLAPGGGAALYVRPVTGLLAGTYTDTLTVTADHGITLTAGLSFTVNAANYEIAAAPAALTFGSLAEGYMLPDKQTVTVTNTGNQSISLYQPASVHYTIGTLSGTALLPGGTATFTVVQKRGLAAGTWNENIEVFGSHGVKTRVAVTFTCLEPLEYFIISGDGSTYGQDDPDSSGIVITANGNIGKFTGLTINGDPVDESNYDVTEGSTIVTLHRDYLNTLAAGTYILTFHYTDGQAEADFVVYDRMPVTGDNDVLAVCGTLIVLSILALLCLRRRCAIR